MKWRDSLLIFVVCYVAVDALINFIKPAPLSSRMVQNHIDNCLAFQTSQVALSRKDFQLEKAESEVMKEMWERIERLRECVGILREDIPRR